jgi:hypothetical protein
MRIGGLADAIAGAAHAIADIMHATIAASRVLAGFDIIPCMPALVPDGIFFDAFLNRLSHARRRRCAMRHAHPALC